MYIYIYIHEQRSLVGYSPWAHKESDRTKQLTLSLSFTCISNIYELTLRTYQLDKGTKTRLKTKKSNVNIVSAIPQVLLDQKQSENGSAGS